jgi:asparagine synthetase B (glutamine-hydrolysing)
MCGISGFNWPDDALTRSMNEALRHRGPDDDAAVFDLLDRETYRRVASQLTPNMRFRLICLERVMQRMAA